MHLTFLLTSSLLALTAAQAPPAPTTGAPPRPRFDPGPDGNCQTGNYTLRNPARWRTDIGNDHLPVDINPNVHDWVLQNNVNGVNVDGTQWRDVYPKPNEFGEVTFVNTFRSSVIIACGTLNHNRNLPSHSGVVKVSHSRYIKYGRLTARFAASDLSGIVTTFITMSDRKDEIDWETVGKDKVNAQTNIFYKGIEGNHGIHGGVHPVRGGGIGTMHTYVIDWTRKAITFSIDGTVVRTVAVGSLDRSAVNLPAGENWYPSTPSLVQLSVWDRSQPQADSWAGNANWGPGVQATATFDWLHVQCYDENDLPVERFGSVQPNVTATPSATTSAAAPVRTNP
ncbi:hypothetical protein HK104_003191, partial [Borealophlyctis nickersoniae]